jgi:lipopolysaccharide/colanic/teichoic acid biosynthesis glycosyltransferase
MLLKRVFDVVLSVLGLVLASPVLLPTMVAVWLQDFHSPFYIAPRVGRGGRAFRMVKLRSMVVNADKSGVDSTGANDRRITAIGSFVRRFKLDELTQLWNVLIGDMSLVGPRPNVKRETDLYTAVEQQLLSVQPGITDFASIIFADEGEILADKPDPDIAYNQLVRPWKSRLGIFYIEHRGLLLDASLCALTVVALINRAAALAGVARILKTLGADGDLVEIAYRRKVLEPCPPPGATEVVVSRLAAR